MLDETEIAELSDPQSELWKNETKKVLPVGKNFDESKYTKNTTAKRIIVAPSLNKRIKFEECFLASTWSCL